MSVEDKPLASNFVPLARGMQPTGVRAANQRLVLMCIAIEAGLSNADLARRTRLAPQTVSAVLAGLADAGLVIRGEVLRGRRGQPATPVFLNERGAFAIGAEIGLGHVEVVLTGFSGQVIERYRRDYDYPDALTVFDEIGRVVDGFRSRLQPDERRRIIGLGLATPGGIGETMQLLAPPSEQAARWAGLDIVSAARRATGLDVKMFNDGNAACWSELAAFPPPRPGSFAFLLIDTFVAAGIVAEGRLWEGVSGASANLGSMLVTDQHGRSAFLHEIASLFALKRKLRQHGFDPAMALGGDEPDAAAAPVLAEWIEDSAFAIAQTILNTATVLEFEVAVVEAVLPSALIARLIEATRRQIESVPSLGRRRPSVVAGHLGRSGAAQGAAQLRMYRRYFSHELSDIID